MSDPQPVSDFGKEYIRLLLLIEESKDDTNARTLAQRQLAELIKTNARREW